MDAQPQITGRKVGTDSRPVAWRVDDAARQLGVGRSSIYKLAGEGKLRLVRIAGRTTVPDEEVLRLAREGA